MVDRNRLNEELRALKKKIKSDPQVLAKYDLDGDGEISGQEWDLARKAVIAALETGGRGPEGNTASGAAMAGSAAAAGIGGAADKIYGLLQNRAAEGSQAQAGTLLDARQVTVQQVVESLELMTSFEGRNRYKFQSPAGQDLAYAEESDTGLGGAVMRNLFSTSRSFTMGISIHNTPDVIQVNRQFEFIFSRIKVSDGSGPVGEVNQKFSILTRKYELVPYFDGRRLEISGPLFKPWTFNILDGSGRQVGSIKKKWSGLMKEAFTKADTFDISLDGPDLKPAEKKLIFAAAIAIDIDHFEKKQKS